MEEKRRGSESETSLRSDASENAENSFTKLEKLRASKQGERRTRSRAGKVARDRSSVGCETVKGHVCQHESQVEGTVISVGASGVNAIEIEARRVEGETEIVSLTIEGDESYVAGGIIVHNTEICIALDGLTWELPESGDPEDYGGYVPIDHDKEFPGPTAHFNCRSTQVSLLKSFNELKGELDPEHVDQISEATRASMDGQVGVVDGYAGWLDGKSVDEQNAILGETAASLWRDGKLDLTDITDQSNRPLTSEELLAQAGQ